MLLTVKKQIEETVEIKTPSYYKNYLGNLHHINEAGQLTVVRKQMIHMWDAGHGETYTDAIAELIQEGDPCTKEEFDQAFTEAMNKLKEAAGLVEVNS
jgi:hypothetical protein